MPETANGDLAALNNCLSGFTNLRVSLSLVSDHLKSLQRTTRFCELIFSAQGELYGVQYKGDPGSFETADSRNCVQEKSDCEWLPKYVDSLWEAQPEVDGALAALPVRLAEKLDALTQTPWIATVRRHLIDKVLAWPGEPIHQTAWGSAKVCNDVAKLLEMADKFEPYPTWDRYFALMSEYAHDLYAIRDAVQPEAGPTDQLPGGRGSRRTRPIRSVDSATEARNRWIYKQCCALVPYDTIAIQLKKKPKSWLRIDSKQGIRAAAVRYAQRHNLPSIPERQE
jgi:hypothetical protein